MTLLVIPAYEIPDGDCLSSAGRRAITRETRTIVRGFCLRTRSASDGTSAPVRRDTRGDIVPSRPVRPTQWVLRDGFATGRQLGDHGVARAACLGNARHNSLAWRLTEERCAPRPRSGKVFLHSRVLGILGRCVATSQKIKPPAGGDDIMNKTGTTIDCAGRYAVRISECRSGTTVVCDRVVGR